MAIKLPSSNRNSNEKKAAKRTLARLEGVEDASQISPMARFLAGGVGGVVSQCVQYHATRRKYIILI